MNYRTFVVHVGDGDGDERRLEVAMHLARSFEARLVGMYLVPTREMTPFTSAMLPDTVVEHHLRDSGHAQARAEARFHDAALRSGVADSEWRAPAGPPLDAAMTHARYADAAIVGQPAPDDAHPAFARDLVHAALIGSGRPALVIPYAGSFPTVGENVLIAWKESRESARAVADALPLLRKARRVVVMSIATAGDADVADTRADRNIAAYLLRHDIAADVRHEVAADIDVGALLLTRAADAGSDLLVMGAYSRPRLREKVLGGVTQTMLTSMTMPVLMSH